MTKIDSGYTNSGYIDPMALHRVRAKLFIWLRKFFYIRIDKTYEKYTLTIDDQRKVENKITKSLMAAYKLGDKRKL